MHFSYYYASKNLILENQGIRKNGIFYNFNNVEQIWIHKPHDYTGRYNPFSEYFYVKLVFKDKTKLFVTSLFSDEIDAFLLSKINTDKVFRENGMFANFPEW